MKWLSFGNMRLFPIFFVTLFLSTSLYSQDDDSTQTLEMVTVKAYGLERKKGLVPAPVNIIRQKEMYRVNDASLVNSLNATPGVRMEERSPGSYRLNIRGSSLRSPFGVRNVKIYFNELPFTDPGGSSFFNQLALYEIAEMEIIRGPASSMYGAGMGGVVLINSIPRQPKSGTRIGITAGSRDYYNGHVYLISKNGNTVNQLGFSHQQSAGYRDHTRLKRQLLSWHGNLEGKNTTLGYHFMAGNLFYETPGGLTLAEYNSNREAARPAAGSFPSATRARASIDQQMLLGGLTLKNRINGFWSSHIAVYGSYAQLKNPSFRNYGRTREPHMGGRTTLVYRHAGKKATITWNTGLEWQEGFSRLYTYSNREGRPGNLQVEDRVRTRRSFVFTQADLNLKNKWLINGGISLNHAHSKTNRLFPLPGFDEARRFRALFAPRLSLLRTLGSHSIYISASRGFSPPTLAEIIPSTNQFNRTLEAETGWNLEAGSRFYFFENKLELEANIYYTRLKNGIVQRRDSTGGDFFINAGSVNQPGTEWMIRYRPAKSGVEGLKEVTVVHNWYLFRYDEFRQLNNIYNGNKLPGIPTHQLSFLGEWQATKRLYSVISWQFNSRAPLEDANLVYTEAWHLIDFRIGYAINASKETHLDFFVSVSNLLDQNFSLGNDINAAAGRYYNPAPGRMFSVGLRAFFNGK